MSKHAIGFVLIDAPHSALNMAGAIVGEQAENATAVKAIQRGRDFYPYVSAQAWRRWWRDALEERFAWPMSPIDRKEKIAFTRANPFSYPDDDVFGYMRAQSKAEGGTLTRVSPLKTSPLISVLPQKPARDFGVMARHEGDPVPHEHQFYSTVLKGIFALDLGSVGVFGQAAQTGFQNLTPEYVKKSLEDTVKESKAELVENAYVLPREVRIERAQQTIACLPFLAGGAKQTLHHTDVTPKVIVLAVVDGGLNLFMNIAAPDEEKLINVKALREVLHDYQDSLLSDVYIGRQEGFQDGLSEELAALSQESFGERRVLPSSPKQAIEAFAAALETQFPSA
jgi:CRISPR-associated protein Cst2